MWIFTSEGFFSVIHTEGNRPKEVTVRSRCRDDLERMLTYAQLGTNIIQTSLDRDYPYRVVIPRIEWTRYLSSVVQRLVYPNFHESLSEIDEQRFNCYSEIWWRLVEWEAEMRGVSMKELRNRKKE